MPKLAGPLLSLQAQGTIGDTITYTRHQGKDIAKSIPTHPDARTLAQFYQRCSFTDALFYWASLSQAQKDAFRDQPYPQHLTAQQKAIRYYLRNLPDLSAAWSFDSLATNQALDRSKNALHLTSNFTTTTPGIIANAAYFDSIDDQAWIADNPALRPTGGLTLSLFLSRRAIPVPVYPLQKYTALQPCFGITITTEQTIRLVIFQTPAIYRQFDSLTAIASLNRTYHIAARWQPATQMAIFIDGNLDAYITTTIPTTINQGTSPLTIPYLPGSFPGTIDDLRIYNRALSDGHIANIAQTRHPAPDN